MNTARRRNGGEQPSPWVNAACALFQPESFLCGGVHDLAPKSPAHGSFPAGNFACGQSPNDEEDLKATMKTLDQKFTPHLCEDRGFFVIQNGATSASIDAE